MNSEKVKEIKECLQSCNDDKMACYDCKYYEKCEKILTKNNILNLINELESENAYKQEHIELWFRKNEEKKKRIAELEKENEKLLDSVETVQNDRCVFKCELTKKHLKQFAERLKEHPIMKTYSLHNACERIPKAIDETLKEYEK